MATPRRSLENGPQSRVWQPGAWRDAGSENSHWDYATSQGGGRVPRPRHQVPGKKHMASGGFAHWVYFPTSTSSGTCARTWCILTRTFGTAALSVCSWANGIRRFQRITKIQDAPHNQRAIFIHSDALSTLYCMVPDAALNDHYAWCVPFALAFAD